MALKAMPDIVVVLPGILGSVLQKHGKDVWALSAGAAIGALTTLGRSIEDLKLVNDSPTLDDLGDGVTAPRVMNDVHLIPDFWKIDGYTKLIQSIKATFEVTEGRNFFQFPYDWRRDNRVAARRLANESRDWLDKWRKSDNKDARLILIGHSMGGLVARQFLELHEGWRDTRLLVTFGTPYRGSLNALDTIANGVLKKLGPFALDLSELFRSFTSVYQLLPIYGCVDTGAGTPIELGQANGIPHLDSTRVADARAFHQAIEDSVTGHLSEPAYRDHRYSIHPVIGLSQPTFQSARLTNGRLEMLGEIEDADESGDGTVPRVSASPKELGSDPPAMFVGEKHASLQNNDSVWTQLMGLMTGLTIMQRGVANDLTLSLDDLYLPDEPIRLRVTSTMPVDDLAVSLFQEGSEAPLPSKATVSDADNDWKLVDFPPLRAGTYRATVSAAPPTTPVSDIFMVVPARSLA